MAVYNPDMFQLSAGQLDARDVDLDSLFAENNRLRELERSNRINNGITNALGVLNGVNGVLGASLPLSRTAQTYGFDYNLNNLSLSGTMDYSTNEQLMSDYDRTNYGLYQDYNKVRGVSDGQVIGSALSSGLSGAMTIGRFLPGIGHGLGFLFGAGVAGASAEAGKNDALNKTTAGNLNVGLARLDNSENRQAQAEGIRERNYRFAQSNVAANGGKMETLEHFAERVLGKKSSILPQRVLCKGGVRVKIKR